MFGSFLTYLPWRKKRQLEWSDLKDSTIQIKMMVAPESVGQALNELEAEKQKLKRARGRLKKKPRSRKRRSR